MAHLRSSTLALCLGLFAAPALAAGISFDLPRLDFPAPAPETTRDCGAASGQTACTPVAR